MPAKNGMCTCCRLLISADGMRVVWNLACTAVCCPMILSYVDDLICVGPSVGAIYFVFDTVGKHVKLKRTDMIHDRSKVGSIEVFG